MRLALDMLESHVRDFVFSHRLVTFDEQVLNEAGNGGAETSGVVPDGRAKRCLTHPHLAVPV